jgi:hypothetical protein
LGESSTLLIPPVAPHLCTSLRRTPPPAALSMFARSFLAAVVAMSAIAQTSAFAPSAGLAGMSRRMPLRSAAPRALRRPGAWLCPSRACTGRHTMLVARLPTFSRSLSL